MIWLGGFLLTILGAVFGRIFSQSEVVLAEKRRVYETFLVECPSPTEAYIDWTEEVEADRQKRLSKVQGPLLLYGSVTVALAFGIYLERFGEADQLLTSQSPALHPAYKALAKAQNDMVLEMRRDALGWSFFGYFGKSRLPDNALESAKQKNLE